MGTIYRRGGMLWVRLSVGGRKIRLSTGVPAQPNGKIPREARDFYLARLAEIGKGAKLGGGQLRFEDLESALTTRYKAEGRSSALRNAKARMEHLKGAFGGWPAASLTEEAILSYAVRRRDKEGAAVDTINLELAYLRRAFHLLRRRLPSIPEIHLLPGAKARQGTVSTEQLTRIIARLGPLYGAVALFLRLTGWRCSEGTGLEWRRVDWQDKLIRLETSKSGEPRVFAFGKYPRLHALLRCQRMRQSAAGLIVPYVFHRPDGRQITSPGFRVRWTRARNSLGYTVRVHDLRRSRVVELERNRVPMTVGMSSVGMKTPQIYRRYGVVSPQEQAQWMDCAEPQEKIARMKH